MFDQPNRTADIQLRIYSDAAATNLVYDERVLGIGISDSRSVPIFSATGRGKCDRPERSHAGRHGRRVRQCDGDRRDRFSRALATADLGVGSLALDADSTFPVQIHTTTPGGGNLVMWLDASDIDGAGDGTTGDPAPGANVTTWVDKAGGDNNAINPFGTVTVNASDNLNGNPLVNFASSGSGLDLASDVTAQESTVFIVYRQTPGVMRSWMNLLQSDANVSGNRVLHVIGERRNAASDERGAPSIPTPAFRRRSGPGKPCS